MSYNFLEYDQEQMLLLPPSLQEWVGDGSLAKLVSAIVEELDGNGELCAFYARYRTDGWGRAAYPPRMMVKVLLYGYSLGVRSSRKIEQALESDIGFRFLAANLKPNFRTISDFRLENLAALEGLFSQVLRLCQEAGLGKLGQVALDGRRVKAATILERNRTKQKLEEQARRILEEAAAVDAAEDALYGEDSRGDELPEQFRTQKGQLTAIRRALQEINQAEEKIRKEHQEKVEAREAQRRLGKRPKGAEPKLKEEKIRRIRVNPTDPDSRTIKTRRGFIQGYNGQAMVDRGSQVIVAQDLCQAAGDFQMLAPMLDRCEEQAGARPEVCIADGGYWSETNALLEDERTELFIAVGSSLAIEEREYRPRKRKNAPRKGPQAVQMRKKLEAPDARAIYKLRSQTVEPVFGQMHERGLDQFLLRGLKKVHAEWSMFCTSHNILKLWRSLRYCTA